MSSDFTPLHLAKAENFSAPNPPKDYNLPPPKMEKYTRTYFSYNHGAHDLERFGSPATTRIGDPLFEAKKAVANIKKKIKDNKVEWKLNLRLRDAADIAGCTQLDLAVRQIVFKYKAKYKVNSFTVENPGDLRGVFFYSRDDNGNIIEGTDPMMSFKMEKGKTAFKKLNFEFGPDGSPVIDPMTNRPKYSEEEINYEMLENKSFECGLVFSLRDLYHSNGMPIPSLFVRTCWVLSPPTEKGSVDSKQSAVLKDFLEGANTEQLNTLMKMIGQLKSGQGASLLESLSSGTGSSSAPAALPAPSGVPALPAPPAASQSTNQQKQIPTVSYPQMPQASSPSKPPAPTIDLSAYMNPGQSSVTQAPQSFQQMPQGYQQGYPQMPPGYTPEAFAQFLQSGAGGQPQGSVTRL